MFVQLILLIIIKIDIPYKFIIFQLTWEKQYYKIISEAFLSKLPSEGHIVMWPNLDELFGMARFSFFQIFTHKKIVYRHLPGHLILVL